jgi:hypothetical protein
MIFRRKTVPEELRPAFESFGATLRVIDEAKDCLTAVMPSTRLPGRPLADALAEFETLLGRARNEMEGWNAPEVAPEWRAAEASIARSQDRARRLREEASVPEGFESLLSTVGALLDPLDAFGAAAIRFRELRAVGRAPRRRRSAP